MIGAPHVHAGLLHFLAHVRFSCFLSREFAIATSATVAHPHNRHGHRMMWAKLAKTDWRSSNASMIGEFFIGRMRDAIALGKIGEYREKLG
jgi:hypothetical protein